MRITDLNTLVTASLNDILYIVDVSDTGDFISGSSKQITVGNFFSSSNVGGGGGGGGTGGSGYLVITSSVMSSSVNLESETIISDGATTVYTITGSYGESSDALIFINGVSQIPTTNYTLTSSTLTLNGLPSSGSKIEIRRFKTDFNITYVTSSMGVEYFSGNNSTTQFTLTNGQPVLHNYDVLVSIDGLIQKPTTDYSISGSIISFTIAPPNNTDIEVRYLSPQSFTFITSSGGGSSGSGGTGAGFPFSGSAVITGSLLVTQYITGSLTGSLLGTASYSNNSISSSYALTSSYVNTSSYSFYATTASYALTSAGGGGTFPYTGNAEITGTLTVTNTVKINDTTISASNGNLYLNGTILRTIGYAYFSSSISSSSEKGVLNIRNDLLQGRSLLSGNIYITNLSSASNATVNIYNASTSTLFQTETIGSSQNYILSLSDFVPLVVSGSGYFSFQITSSVT
jgi:hypothetical protein